MRKLSATLCLTIAVLLGGEVRGSEYQKGLAAAQSGYIETALRETISFSISNNGQGN
jgi:hypothetical protein